MSQRRSMNQKNELKNWRKNNMMDYIKNRMKESSTLDGAGILIACVLIILFGPLAKIIAYAGIAYSIWKILKKD